MYESMQKQLFSKIWFRITCVFLLLILLLVIYLIWKTPDVEKGEVGTEESWENFQQELVNFRENEESLENHETHHDNGTSIEGTRNVEDGIEFFFLTVKAEDTDLFGSSITTERFQNDFFHYGVIERIDKMEEAMKRITRDGQLEQIEIVQNLWQFDKHSTQVVVDLNYKDQVEPIRINIKMTSSEYFDPHSEEEDYTDSVYQVNTSVWELIQNIEGKVND